MTNQTLEELIYRANNHWSIPFEDFVITIQNEANAERLFINNTLVTENIRESIYSLKPYQTLRYTYIHPSGRPYEIYVKIGGFIAIHLNVKVNNKQIFKDKVSFFK